MNHPISRRLKATNRWLISRKRSVSLLGVLVAASLQAQSDNFDSGNDSAWTREDPIHQAGFPPQVTFSFPSGGYRIQTAVSPEPGLVGPGRGGSAREDVTYGSSFFVAVDLRSWNDNDQQVASVVARITTPGLGTTAGYLFGYNNAFPGLGQGEVGIYRLTNEQFTTLTNAAIHLSPTNSYRLVFFGQDTDLEGRIYLLPDTNTSIYSLSASDATYASGYSGLAQADASSAKNSPTDATYDNYFATNFCIAEQPRSVVCMTGAVVTLSATAVGTAPVTYQWMRNGTNLFDSGNISGSTNSALMISNVTSIDATSYTLVAMDAAARSATSVVATVSLLNLTHGSPAVEFDFEDGNIPPATALTGNAYIGTDDASGLAVHLTDAFDSEMGSFVVTNLDSGDLITSFDAQFDVLIGGSSTSKPADGLSFNWATDLPDSFGESGGGTGLTVTFELYNFNENLLGPGVNVMYGGALVAQQFLPFSFLQTGDDFVPVDVRLAPGGYLTIVYNSIVLYDRLPIPGLAGGLSGANFGWGARTGSYNDNFWLDNVQLTTLPRILNFSPGNLALNFCGVLQSATNLSGPYQDLPAAVSPYTFTPAPDVPQMFWRARSP